MAGDAPSGHNAGSGSPFLPPVFTYRPGPSVETASAPAAPPTPPRREEAPPPASPVRPANPQRPEAATAPTPDPAVEHATVVRETASEDAHAPDTNLGEGDGESFPIDAFIIPEEADRLPAGMSAPSSRQDPLSTSPEPAFDRATRLADRLEALARRLRAEGPAALGAGIEFGDRFDAVLTGLLAGYLAAGDE